MNAPADRHKPTAKLAAETAPRSGDLAWTNVLGAFGPSDGSGGPLSNVPSALAVLRHAPLYAGVPAEIEDAFAVLEHHAAGNGLLYPAGVRVLPFLFDLVARGGEHATRIADLIARYATLQDTLDAADRSRLVEAVIERALDVTGWLGRHDRAAAALAIHVPALRPAYLAAVEGSPAPSQFALLALLALRHGTAPLRQRAEAIMDHPGAAPLHRAAAAAYLAELGPATPSLRERIDAALPPSAPAALANLVDGLWQPDIQRPVVAPKLCTAEVVFVGEKLVQVRAGERRVTLPLPGSHLQPGDRIQVGLSVHGQPRLALLAEPDGGVRVERF